MLEVAFLTFKTHDEAIQVTCKKVLHLKNSNDITL